MGPFLVGETSSDETIGGDLQQYGYNYGNRNDRRDGILGQLFGDNR